MQERHVAFDLHVHTGTIVDFITHRPLHAGGYGVHPVFTKQTRYSTPRERNESWGRMYHAYRISDIDSCENVQAWVRTVVTM